MEEEKSQPPDHQLQPTDSLKAIYDVYTDEDEDEDGEGVADQQFIDAAIAAPVYDDDVHMEEDEKDVAVAEQEEEADRQNRAAAIAADEDMAHRMYIEELMGMEEWQLRAMDRPSLRAALELPLSDFPSSSSSSRAGVGFNPPAQGPFSAGTPPYALNPKDPVVQPYVPPPMRARGAFENVQHSESIWDILGEADKSRSPAGPLEVQAEKGKGPLEVQPEKGKGPFELKAEERIREILATGPSASHGRLSSSLGRREAERAPVFLPRSVNIGGTNATRGFMTGGGFMSPGPRDFATTTPARKTVQDKFKDAAGSSSSSQQVPRGDGKAAAAATVPTVTPAPPANVVKSAGCGAAAPRARPFVPANNDDPVSTKRRALLAEDHSAIKFAAMEEWNNNNEWYESIAVPDDDDDEKPEQVELQDLNESLQQCLTRSDYKPAPTVAQQGTEISIQDFCQKWEVTPSDIEPDPSTRAPPRVRPLADHEVPTFDCGICFETLQVFDLFHGLPCKHRFCAPCMTTYVEGRIRASELPIPCPDTACGTGGAEAVLIHPEACKKAIDYAAFGDWGARIAESALPPDRRAYCPNRRCGELLETSGEAEPARALCPACGLPLCATCGLQWSADGDGDGGVHDCARGPDAALVRRLAQDRRWKECPNCKMLVERSYGCNRMTCRCRFVFCYRCGKPMFPGQAGGAGLEPCRCHNAGLAFAMAHHHQAHANIVDQAMQLRPVEVNLNVAPLRWRQPNIVDQAMQLPPMEVDLNMTQPQPLLEEVVADLNIPPLELNMQPRWDDPNPAEESDDEIDWSY